MTAIVIEDWKAEFKALEGLLRSGRMLDAQKELRRLLRQKVPRLEQARMAQYLLRAGWFEKGVSLLARYVRPSARSTQSASPAEVAEYAGLLVRLDAVEEAIELLATVDAKAAPRADLYRAFAHAARWEYAETLEPLRRFSARYGKGSYERLVAQVNIAAALVFERDEVKATSLLRELLHETSLRGYPLLLANTLELTAEHFILMSRWAEAEEFLQKGKALIGGSGSIYEFLLAKWGGIAAYLRGESASLDGVRALAEARGNWETLRECARFELRRRHDEALASKLWFGTPFPAYRRRLESSFPEGFELPHRYRWIPPGGAQDAATFDALTGEYTDRRGRTVAVQRAGQLPHLLFLALASDFFRPQSIARLYAKMHPGMHFRPGASAARVYEIARILRVQLEEHGVPLDVVAENGTYRLVATGPVAVSLERDETLGTSSARELKLLRERWANEEFSVAEAVALLDLPRRSVQRILGTAHERGLLTRSGQSRYTRYRFRPS